MLERDAFKNTAAMMDDWRMALAAKATELTHESGSQFIPIIA